MPPSRLAPTTPTPRDCDQQHIEISAPGGVVADTKANSALSITIARMDADSQGSDVEDVKPKTGEKRDPPREKRTSRACLTCRKRKSACDL